MLDNKSSNNINNSEFNNSTINQYKDCIFINQIEDSEILDKIITEMLKKTRNDINLGNYEEVNNLLRGYMTSEGFDKLPKGSKIDIIYYRAISLLNIGKYDEAKAIAEQILGIDKNSLKYYEFKASLNILTVNREEYIKYINELKELNESENVLKIYDIKMLYNEEKYDEIIKEYIENNSVSNKLPKTDECIGIVISSLMIKNEKSLAKKVLKNIEIKTEYVLYLIAVINLCDILNDKDGIFKIDKVNKKILDENIELLKSVKDYFNKNIIYRKYYYYYLLSSLLIQKPVSCIREYENLNDELKKEKKLKIIYMDALLLTNQIDLAEKNIMETSNYLIELEFIVRLIDILDIKKDYKKVVELLQGKDLKNLDDNGFLATKYVEALINEKGIEEAEKIIDEGLMGIPLVNVTIAEYLCKKEYQSKKVIQYCNKAIQTVDLNDELVVQILSEKFEKMHLYSKSIQLLEKCKMKSMKTKIFYIRSVIQNEKGFENSTSNALKIVDEIIETEGKSDELLIYKGDLLRKKNRNEEAFKCYEEAFNMSKSYISAYYCLSSKYQNQDYYNIDKYINVLNNSNQLEHMIIVAAIYAKQKKFEEANKKIYSIIYILKDETNLDILSKIIFGIYYTDYREYKWQTYSKVVNDTIAILKSEDDIIKKVCIETDIKMHQENEKLYDVELYSYQSTMNNKLIFKKKEDIVIIDDKKFYIIDIVNKYEYFLIKIRDIFLNNIPNKSKYGMFIKTDTKSKDPLKEIIPILQDRKRYISYIVDKYRMKDNEVGLTISKLSQIFGCDECSIIISLLNDEDGMYYAGEISDEVIEEYVVTMTSLIVLKFFGMDKILIDNRERIHIAESTIKKLDKYLLEKANDNYSASLGIGKDNKPYMIKNTEEKVEDEIEFIRELIEIANQLKIEKNNYQEDKSNIYSILDEEEQDAMCIAKDNHYTLIADDLCLRRIYVYFSNKDRNTHSNSMEFIKYMTFEKRIEVLEEVSKTQYLYCINKKIVIELLFFCQEEEKIKNILSNLLGTFEKYNYNRKIIGEAILELCKARIEGKRKDRLIMVIKLILSIDKEYREN